ncbi:hypothetical protein PMIN07_010421 [Paraphaeosphaeria minitans]
MTTAAITPHKSTQATTSASDGGDDSDSDDKGFVCPHCGQVYAQEHNMKRHLRDSHGTREKPYACPGCSHRSKRKDNLKKHMKASHGTGWGQRLYDAVNDILAEEGSEAEGQGSGAGDDEGEEGDEGQDGDVSAGYNHACGGNSRGYLGVFRDSRPNLA